MLGAAVARSHAGEESGQQAERSGLLPRSLHFPRDPVSAAKKVHTSQRLSSASERACLAVLFSSIPCLRV